RRPFAGSAGGPLRAPRPAARGRADPERGSPARSGALFCLQLAQDLKQRVAAEPLDDRSAGVELERRRRTVNGARNVRVLRLHVAQHVLVDVETLWRGPVAFHASTLPGSSRSARSSDGSSRRRPGANAVDRLACSPLDTRPELPSEAVEIAAPLDEPHLGHEGL